MAVTEVLGSTLHSSTLSVARSEVSVHAIGTFIPLPPRRPALGTSRRGGIPSEWFAVPEG
jgi:hypothetical protein